MKQTLKIDLSPSQLKTDKPKAQSQDAAAVMQTNPKHMFRYDTLPDTQSVVGNEKARELLREIIAESKSESDRKDHGCICEIDLS